MAKHRRRSTRRRQPRRRLSGGEGGATGHGAAAFGAPDQQHSVAGTQSGPISVNPSTGGGALSPAPFAGGRDPGIYDGEGDDRDDREPMIEVGGRGILNEVAVPALLLYANTVYKPSQSRKVGKRSRKSRRSARRRR